MSCSRSSRRDSPCAASTGWPSIVAASCARRSPSCWPISRQKGSRASWFAGSAAAEPQRTSVLYALGVPLNFLALLLGFGLAILGRGMAQAWTARALGSRDFEVRARCRPDIRRHGDVFGLIAAVLGGTGWGREAPVAGLLGRYAYGRARGRPAVNAALMLLVGPLVAGLLGVVALVAARAAGAAPAALHQLTPSDALHGDIFAASAGLRFLTLVCVA